MNVSHCTWPQSPRWPSALLAVVLWFTSPASVWAQSITANLPVAGSAIAVNATTHKVYVADASGTVTVVDGATHTTTALQVGGQPAAVAVNQATNRIYVANKANNNVTVIDGATNALTTVSDPNAKSPVSLAVNPSTNRVYVANVDSGNVTVIDGATNATVTVGTPIIGGAPASEPRIAVNPVTNEVYVAQARYVRFYGYRICRGGTVTVIDGASNATTGIDLGGNYKSCGTAGIAVNAVSNKVFTAVGGGVAVIDGATKSATLIAYCCFYGAIAVNSSTNRIYATSPGSVTVIDGATSATTRIADPDVVGPAGAAVDEATNTVYIAASGGGCGSSACNPGSTTAINGVTNATTTIIDPKATAPRALAIDPATNQVYVANSGSANLTVIGGGVAPTSHALAVILDPASGGAVTSHPAGIDCSKVSTSCAASFPVGTLVDLTASGVAGLWLIGGSCPGTGACQVTMNSDLFVTAAIPVAVPNVIGLQQAAAEAAITSAGLSVGTETQSGSNGVAPGNVTNESPAAGSRVVPGSAVNLTISNDVTVPSVVGADSTSATAALTGAGLAVTTVTMQSSSTVPSGSVISQSPAGGTYVAPGSDVALVVSSGGGGGGGGGATDWLTIDALLCWLALRRRRSGSEMRGAALPAAADLPAAVPASLHAANKQPPVVCPERNPCRTRAG